MIHHRLAAVAAILVAMPVAAEPPADGRTIHEAAFFAPFAPQTAADIVARIPGFRLEEGDSSVRGFGGAAGNVVINGRRPSTKSEGLQAILARLPAARVVRVEVGPGDLFGAEFAGRPQVANLVLSGDGGISGTAEAAIRRSFAGEWRPDGRVSALLKQGSTSFSGAVALQNGATSEVGNDALRRLPSGELIEFRRKFNRIRSPELALSGAITHEGGDRRVASLNGRFEREWFRLNQTNRVDPAASGPPRDDRLTQRYDPIEWEVGGDLTRPLGGGALKLIGLYRIEREHDRDRSLFGVETESVQGFAQEVKSRQIEAVGRLVWSHPDAAGWNVEAGGEAVLNRLDSDVRLVALEPGGIVRPIDLPLAQAIVREERAELFLNAGRALSPSVRLDLGLVGEASTLNVSGDAQARRTLRFLKPTVSLDARKGRWKLQASIKRTVAQLDFSDFISAAELSNDRVNGGNADLEPQRAWELLATAEHPLAGDGVIRVEAGYQRIEKVQDRVPTPEGFDAPGNLGLGQSWIGRVRLDASLARLGIRGGRLTARLSVVETAVTDPYTGARRRFSGNSPWILDVGFRQDLGRIAWGIDTWSNPGSTTFRRTEEDRSFRQNPYVSAFVEARPDSRTTIRLAADNLLDINFYRERTFFLPDRSAVLPALQERRTRRQHIIPLLTVTRGFG